MEPLLLHPGDGETITDAPERLVRILVDDPRITLTQNRYAQGESGPGAHVHRQHSDCFFVTEGELRFELGPDGSEIAAGPDTFVLVPPGLVHTFRNAGPDDAHFLNIHAPSKGFGDHLRSGSDASSDDFDTFEPPADGGAPATSVIVRPPGEGEVIQLGESGGRVKAGGTDAIGSVMVLDSRFAPGFEGPPPHRHRETIDSFYVREGTLTLLLGDERIEAGPGTYAFVPTGTRHTFANASGERTGVLNIMVPGGFEAYLLEVSAHLRETGGQPSPEELARVASKYDYEPVG